MFVKETMTLTHRGQQFRQEQEANPRLIDHMFEWRRNCRDGESLRERNERQRERERERVRGSQRKVEEVRGFVSGSGRSKALKLLSR